MRMSRGIDFLIKRFVSRFISCGASSLKCELSCCVYGFTQIYICRIVRPLTNTCKTKTKLIFDSFGLKEDRLLTHETPMWVARDPTGMLPVHTIP